MAEYTQDELEKVIKDHQEKLTAKIYALRLKNVQRERIENEIFEAKDEIKKIEDFIKLMSNIQNGAEDKIISAGLKKRTNGRKRSKR